MTSKPESENSENAVSKASLKKQKDISSQKRTFKSLEGKEYSVEELRLLNWEKRIEVLLFNILEQGDELELLGKKILDT